MSKKTICVIGCSGFVGSNVTAELLRQGMSVRGILRKPADDVMDSLREFVNTRGGDAKDLSFVAAEATDADSLQSAFAGCDGVINCAGITKPEPATVETMVAIAEAVCDAALAAGVPVAVFTSSTGSTNPPGGDPPLKNEVDHWSNSAQQLENRKFAAAAKTRYDETIFGRMKSSGGRLRCATINPSMILGPNPRKDPDGSLRLLQAVLSGDRFADTIPNGSMSLIDVRDLAKLHVAALTNDQASGRYFGVVQSWHWKDILAALSGRVPSYTPPQWDAEIEPVTPTQFDTTRRDSLGVELRGIDDILDGAIAELKRRGIS